MDGICEICKEPFKKKMPNQRFCCELHRKRAESRRRYPRNKYAIQNLNEFRFFLKTFDLQLYLEMVK